MTDFIIRTQQQGAEAVERSFEAIRASLKQTAEQGKAAALAIQAVGKVDPAAQLTQRMETVRLEVHETAVEAGNLRQELSNVGPLSLLAGIQEGTQDSIVDVERLDEMLRSIRKEIESPVDNNLGSAINDASTGDTAPDQLERGAGLSRRAFSQLGSAASGLGLPIGGDLRIAGGIAGVTEQLPNVIEQISSIGPVAGVTAVAIGGLAISLKELHKATAAATAPLRDYVAAMPEVGKTTVDLFEIFQSGTTETVTALRQENEIREELLQQQIQQVQEASDAANAGLKQQFGGIGTKFLDLVGYDTDALDEKLQGLQAELVASGGQVEYLNSEFIQSRIAINDMIDELDQARTAQQDLATLIAFGTSQQIEAERTRLKIQQDGAKQERSEIEKQIAEAVRLDAVSFGQTVDAGIDSLSELRDYAVNVLGASTEAVNTDDKLLAFLKALTAGGENFDVLAQKFTGLNKEVTDTAASIEQLDTVAKPQIETREAETAAIKRQSDAMNTLTSERDNLTKQLEDVNGQIASIYDEAAQKAAQQQQRDALKQSQDQREIALLQQIEIAKQIEQQQKAANQVTAIRQEVLVKGGKAVENFRTSETKAEAKFNADITKLEAERGKIAEDAARKRAEIERKASIDILQAQQDRDVLAAERAKQQRGEGLRGVDEETQAKQAEADQKVRELRDQFAAERQERQVALHQQLEQIRTEANERVRATQQAGQQTLSQTQQLEKQLATLRAQFAQENAALQAQFEQAAQQQRVQALQQRAQELQAQIKLINNVLTGNLQVLAGNAAIALIGGFSNEARRLLTGLIGSVNAPRVREQAATPNRRAITAYAEGGITPTGLFAANREEVFSTETPLAILNKDTSKALMAGLRAGQQMNGAAGAVTINLGGIHNPNLGGVATPADVQSMGESVLGVVVEGLRQRGVIAQKGSAA